MRENTDLQSNLERKDESKNQFGIGSEKWRIWKNCVVTSLAFMFHFTAYFGAANLQSSVNSEAALGTKTLAVMYASLILSAIVLPAIIIRWFGTKWTIAYSMILYMPYLIAQFQPSFYTMIPAGVALGLGAGPLWCAQSTYLTVISQAYSRITPGLSTNVVVTRFFGVFYMFVSLSQVWGNLISSTVLSSYDPPASANQTIVNTSDLFLKQTETNIVDLDIIGSVCGAKFFPDSATVDINPNLAQPPTWKLNTITAIYLSCGLIAVLLVVLGVDNMSRYIKDHENSESELSGFKLLTVTVRHLGNLNQALIVPISIFIGAEEGFMTAEYTSAFVSCGWGISNIGYVMICYGICNGIGSICSGSIVNITGRRPVICFAFILHLGLIMTLLFWKPSPEGNIIYFVISGLWGMSDTIWLVQINSLSGILFPGNEEASYSNYRLWESTGYFITFAYSPYICTDIKLYLLLGILVIGTLCYNIAEHRLDRRTVEISEGRKFEMVQDNLVVQNNQQA